MPALARYSLELVNAQAVLIRDLLTSGYLRIYSGAYPNSFPLVVPVGAIKLAELRFKPVAGTLTTGIVIFDFVQRYADVLASGIATWAWFMKADGVTGVMTGNVGVVNENVVLDKTQLTAGYPLIINSCAYQVPQSSS